MHRGEAYMWSNTNVKEKVGISEGALHRGGGGRTYTAIDREIQLFRMSVLMTPSSILNNNNDILWVSSVAGAGGWFLPLMSKTVNKVNQREQQPPFH